MSTTTHTNGTRTMNDTYTYTAATPQDVIDEFSEAGMLPTDEAPVDWLGRYDAYIADDIGDGWIVATHRDETVTVSVLTPSGVVLSECRFDQTNAGLAMLAGALRAITT